MDLQALSLFVLVARHGGFSQAARAAGLSKATLSRRVRELEEQLGVQLLRRSSTYLRLTEQGERLFSRSRGPLSELAEAADALTGAEDAPSGDLRINSTVLFSETALGAVASSYLRRHPQVRIDVVSDDRVTPPAAADFDLYIRVDPRPTDELVGRCFLRHDKQVVASRSLAEALRADPAATVPSVLVSGASTGPWIVEAVADAAAPVRSIAHRPVLRVASLLTARAAVLSGAGAAVLPTFLVAEDLVAGGLESLGRFPGGAVEIWALHPAQRIANRKVASFVDHLVASFPDRTWGARPPFLVDRDAEAPDDLGRSAFRTGGRK